MTLCLLPMFRKVLCVAPQIFPTCHSHQYCICQRFVKTIPKTFLCNRESHVQSHYCSLHVFIIISSPRFAPEMKYNSIPPFLSLLSSLLSSSPSFYLPVPADSLLSPLPFFTFSPLFKLTQLPLLRTVAMSLCLNLIPHWIQHSVRSSTLVYIHSNIIYDCINICWTVLKGDNWSNI